MDSYGYLVAKIWVLGDQNGFRAPQTQFGHQNPTKKPYLGTKSTYLALPKYPYPTSLISFVFPLCAVLPAADEWRSQAKLQPAVDGGQWALVADRIWTNW